MRKINSATPEDVALVDLAILNLKIARNNLVASRSKTAAAKVRKALKSAEGARRHVYHRLHRTEYPA